MTWAGSIFDTAGTQAERIARLAWFLVIASAVTYVLVLAATAIAVRRARARRMRTSSRTLVRNAESRLARNTGIAAIATTLILLVYVTATARTGKGNRVADQRRQPLTSRSPGISGGGNSVPRHGVEQLAHDVERAAHPGRAPGARDPSVERRHPQLLGARVARQAGRHPGHRNTTWIQADRPGVWKARCAEFCGFQHAKMAFDVVAEIARTVQPVVREPARVGAATPDSSAQHGHDVFMQRTCIMCHTISGTQAGSSVGPELTHIASRPSIAAGSLPNTRENLGRWILNPQLIKPGVRMPPNALAPADMNALLDYLETLK
jgi:cytochrome c oxidase subunit 2